MLSLGYWEFAAVLGTINNHSKLVSIITPYRDAELFLPDLVNNLLRQVYQNWECLLVDHWSTDKGTDLLTSMVDNDTGFALFRSLCKRL